VKYVIKLISNYVPEKDSILPKPSYYAAAMKYKDVKIYVATTLHIEGVQVSDMPSNFY